ncbi:hypothetical protein WR25_15776 [Diploscapter pachys]|jgi:lysozyme|uniref:Lysozyme n=1 Tax=Diploscapter pachys TaxID=2018661 RepID=A0A2A2JXF0_9BILA|nr:lysozyme [Sphingomonas melonis]ATI54185.1 lysozyme [Sphingomonas melonis]PAV66395.1 hypothetical protein WR25_15776 [Diploscapter pachys]
MRNGLPIVKEFEGCKLQAYPDPATGGAPWTIAWGRTKGVKKGDTCTQAQADAWLNEEYDEFESAVIKALGGARTTDNQLGAMVCFAYNCGVANLKSSTLLRKHKAGDYAGAAKEFARWNKAAGKVMAGLTRRRAAEAALYLR